MQDPTIHPAFLAQFQSFGKISRLSREIVVTEKIDGTNGQLLIDETGKSMMVGSRNRWLIAGDDNFGFYRWANENFQELLKLGPGRHFGEWYGAGIQRRYGLTEKRFSLFNVAKWESPEARPACCGVVPVLYRGPFCTNAIHETLLNLSRTGSIAAPGFMDPEGIVVYHTASGQLFKKTCKDDEKAKGAQ